MIAEVAIDRFEHGHRATRSEHPPELVERTRLVLDEDQHGPGGDRFHGAVGQLPKVFRRRTHKPTALDYAHVCRQLTAGVQQILRDIAEDHLGQTTLDSAEGDQPVTAANVEQPGLRSLYCGMPGGGVIPGGAAWTTRKATEPSSFGPDTIRKEYPPSFGNCSMLSVIAWGTKMGASGLVPGA